MTKVMIKNLETALGLLEKRFECMKTWSTTFDPARHDILLVDEKLNSLSQIVSEYLAKFNELITFMQEDEVEDRIIDFNELQLQMDDLVVTLKRFKVNHRQEHPPPPPPRAVIQLPAIPLPQFSGSIADWVFFRDKFTALIIENESLNETQRLYYLKSSLIDEAASLQSTNDTFNSLWHALKERFEVKRVIADNQISQILGLRSLPRESAADLKSLVDIVTKCLRVLDTLELPVDRLSELLITNIISTKLDPETRRGFEIHLKPNVLPRVAELLTFLRHRSHTLETIELATKSTSRAATQGPHTPQRKSTSLSSVLHVNSNKCPFCSQSQSHYANQCATFLAMKPDVRYTNTKKAGLCINCLRNDHTSGECKSGVCRQCHKKHHTLLHFEEKRPNQGGAESGDVETNQPDFTTSLVVNSNQVLLSTTIVNILDADSNPVRCRALLDSGSQSNFMTENLARLVRLTPTRVNTYVYGLGQRPTTIKSCVTATIQSLRSPYTAELDFLVVPKVTGHIPNAHLQLNTGQMDLPTSVELADPQFHQPQSIDLLIGAEIFFDIWTGQQLHINNALPPLRSSVFGWVIAGRVSTNLIATNQIKYCGLLSNPDDQPLETARRSSEKKIERHLLETHKRQPNGRYDVTLPTKAELTKLAASRQKALTHNHLEYTPDRSAELRGQYCRPQNTTNASAWRVSAESPADTELHSLTPDEPQMSELWRHGPILLLKDEHHWAQDPVTVNQDRPRMQPNVMATRGPETCERCRGPPAAEEVQTMHVKIVHALQPMQLESPKYSLLCGGKSLSTKFPLTRLTDRLDDQNLEIDVKRTQNSNQGFDAESPVVLPKTQSGVANACAEREIRLHIRSPGVPQLAGIRKTVVKALELHLDRIVRLTPPYLVDKVTELMRIDATLDSRLLVPHDPVGNDSITPGHFPIGRLLVAVVEPNPDNKLKRWPILFPLMRYFGQQWIDERLTTLQHRAKTATGTKSDPGMVALVKKEYQPPSNWLLGRITNVRPGRDDIVRVVAQKTKHGVLDRPPRLDNTPQST